MSLILAAIWWAHHIFYRQLVIDDLIIIENEALFLEISTIILTLRLPAAINISGKEHGKYLYFTQQKHSKYVNFTQQEQGKYV